MNIEKNQGMKGLEETIEVGNKVRGLNERVENAIDNHSGKIAAGIVGLSALVALFTIYTHTAGAEHLNDLIQTAIESYRNPFQPQDVFYTP
jgi:hypothetical protein